MDQESAINVYTYIHYLHVSAGQCRALKVQYCPCRRLNCSMSDIRIFKNYVHVCN